MGQVPSAISLPTEIELMVVELLLSNSTKDLKNFSITSKYYREFLKPMIFEEIILRDDETSASRFSRIVTHGQYHEVVGNATLIVTPLVDTRKASSEKNRRCRLKGFGAKKIRKS